MTILNTTPPAQPASDAAALMAAIKRLELDVCDVLNAATVAGQMLVQIQVERVENGRRFQFEVDKIELNATIFAQGETEKRARELSENFYQLIEGGEA